MSREARPIRAAERRQTLATAGGRGMSARNPERRRRERIFAAPRLIRAGISNHGLPPWLCSVAAPRLNKDAATPRYYFEVAKNILDSSVQNKCRAKRVR